MHKHLLYTAGQNNGLLNNFLNLYVFKARRLKEKCKCKKEWVVYFFYDMVQVQRSLVLEVCPISSQTRTQRSQSFFLRTCLKLGFSH